MQESLFPRPPPLPPPPARADLPLPSPRPSPPSPTRARAPPSEHVQVVRELWVLRERGAVRALERSFLMRLAQLLEGGVRTRAARGDSHWVREDDPHGPDEIDSDTDTPRPVARAREPPAGASRRDADAARAHARVTQLSPEFRARLEGVARDDGARHANGLRRTQSWGALLAQRMVTSALDSAFRHELEGVLVRRGVRNDAALYARGARAVVRTDVDPGAPEEVIVDNDTARRRDTNAAVRELRDEVAALRRVIDASFDVQLDIQRAVRQEVAAALHAPGRGASALLRVPEGGSCSHGTHAHDDACTFVAPPLPRATRAIGTGACSICMDRTIDALLYACGHMCTCAPCGRQLLAHGDACPMCRAPVRDVVVAYIAT